MKLKYFLRGFGTGIIFAALILTISYQISNKDNMTDSQIMKKAKELGMVMEDQNDELKKSLDSIKESTEEPKESVKPSKSKEESKEPEKQENTSKPEERNTPKPTDGPQKTEEDNVKEYVKFSIQQGMSSSQIADYLAGIGIVDDGDKFDDYLCDNGYSNRIVVGNFEVDSNPTYEQVAKTITRSN